MLLVLAWNPFFDKIISTVHMWNWSHVTQQKKQKKIFSGSFTEKNEEEFPFFGI